ncbi:MAG: response regulator [Bacteroidales bacterium]|nr:response regulator [Bacteroidales bacterium]
MSKSILIVEDSNSVREFLKSIILEMGFTCVVAENGEDALNKIPYHSIVLIITDLHMPVMDGFEFIEKVKKNR